MKLIAVLLSVLSGLAMVVVAADSTPSEKIDALQVEVLVFSGRPDPKFIITDLAVIKEITDAVKALPVHPTLKGNVNLTPSGRLGYRGIRVYNVSDINPDIEWFTIRRSDVEVFKKGDNARHFRINSQATVEHRLIQIAEEKKIMSDAVLSVIKTQQ